MKNEVNQIISLIEKGPKWLLFFFLEVKNILDTSLAEKCFLTINSSESNAQILDFQEPAMPQTALPANPGKQFRGTGEELSGFVEHVKHI